MCQLSPARAPLTRTAPPGCCCTWGAPKGCNAGTSSAWAEADQAGSVLTLTENVMELTSPCHGLSSHGRRGNSESCQHLARSFLQILVCLSTSCSSRRPRCLSSRCPHHLIRQRFSIGYVQSHVLRMQGSKTQACGKRAATAQDHVLGTLLEPFGPARAASPPRWCTPWPPPPPRPSPGEPQRFAMRGHHAEPRV